MVSGTGQRLIARIQSSWCDVFHADTWLGQAWDNQRSIGYLTTTVRPFPRKTKPHHLLYLPEIVEGCWLRYIPSVCLEDLRLWLTLTLSNLEREGWMKKPTN